MALQANACTASTYVSHAVDAVIYGQWTEARNLFEKAARLIEVEILEAEVQS